MLVLANLVAGLLSWLVNPWWLILLAVVIALDAVCLWDLVQRQHSLLRNYPVLGHARYLLEAIRPEMQQYFVERNFDGRPFDRDTRTLVYERAKGLGAKKSFGTERQVTEPGYEYLVHSMAPLDLHDTDPRVRIGGPDCTQPYDASIFNISAMSFGSLSPNAVMAMNKGAAEGHFAQDTGEGSVSPYHLRFGADLFWQIGTGYFGCRTSDGNFDPEKFRAKVALPQIKAVYLKISQGAKPGLGGMLPGSKVDAEIAEIRGVKVGVGVNSPAKHRVYSTPRELVRFLASMRELSDGKPVGFKLCVGSRLEFLAVVKAMLAEEVYPDFIIVDGSEGGTGAAPLEYSDRMGMPLTDGLMVVHNALVGAGIRDRIAIGASGKIVTGVDVIKRISMGADFCNSARAMMMATGCIQAQKCHTNECPVGVATQDRSLWVGLDVDSRGTRVRNYHGATVRQAAQLLASMGVDSFSALGPAMVMLRTTESRAESYAELYNWLSPGELLTGTRFYAWREDWARADADTFTYPGVRASA